MNIPKAIEILRILASETQPGAEQDELDAIKLGIEALKAYKTSRDYSSIHHVPLLPGETTE